MTSSIERRRFNKGAEFGKFEEKELPNGNYVNDVFVTKFTRRAALYRVSSDYFSSLEGFNRKTDTVIAVNKQWNDEINEDLDVDAYVVKYNNKFYKIQYLDLEEELTMGCHLITLRKQVI